MEFGGCVADPRKLNIHLATLTPHIIRRIVNRELWTCYHTLASFFVLTKLAKLLRARKSSEIRADRDCHQIFSNGLLGHLLQCLCVHVPDAKIGRLELLVQRFRCIRYPNPQQSPSDALLRGREFQTRLMPLEAHP